jgi:hypothetical protein
MTTGVATARATRRRAMRVAVAIAALAVTAPGSVRAAAPKPPACDSVAVSPVFATDRTALCLYVAEDPAGLRVPGQRPARRVVVRVTRDGGRTWRDARALGLNATTGACAGEGPAVCQGSTAALQALFSADYAADRTAYVALNDRGLFRTTDLGETFAPADPQASAGCCSSFWLEPFRRPGTEADPTPRAPLAMTDGGSSCGGPPNPGTAEVLPPAHRVVLSPSTWPLRFVAPRVARETPVFLAGHHCEGTFPDVVITSRVYACDLRLACRTEPLYALPRRIQDLVAGGDHAQRGSLYATAIVARGGFWRVALYRSLSGGRTWQELRSLDAAIPAGDVDDVYLAAVPHSPLLYAWADAQGNDTYRHVLLRSADRGTTWTRVATSGPRMPWADAERALPTGYYEPSHLTAASADRLFFLGTYPGAAEERRADGSVVHRLWCSVDGGRTWAAACRA